VGFPDGQGEDCADLAFAEIVTDSVSPADLDGKNFLDLGRYRNGPFGVRESSILAVVGYPSRMNTIDYDATTVNTHGLSFDGRYCGPVEESECSKIRINSLGTLEEMDGLSGSPVIEFIPEGENRYRERFAGVFIRGTVEALCGRFVNAPAVYRALGL
jgi:hypothetical protein